MGLCIYWEFHRIIRHLLMVDESILSFALLQGPLQHRCKSFKEVVFLWLCITARSLVAGLTFGGLAAAGAYHASAHPDTPYVGAGVSAVLGGVMGARAAKSGALMPGGLIALLALGMLGK